MISRLERKGVDEIRKGHRLGGESDLGFLNKMYLLFHAINRLKEEAQNISIVFGRLAIKWQDKILELYAGESLSLEV